VRLGAGEPGALIVSHERAIVIFGATGDLALRMLLPSLYFLEADGLAPPGLAVIGAARTEIDDGAFEQRVEDAVRTRAGSAWDPAVWSRLRERLGYVQVDAAAPSSFDALAVRLAGVREVIFYLSTSPSLYGEICAGLRRAGLAGDEVHLHPVIGETKPFGRPFDLEAVSRPLVSVDDNRHVLLPGEMRRGARWPLRPAST